MMLGIAELHCKEVLTFSQIMERDELCSNVGSGSNSGTQGTARLRSQNLGTQTSNGDKVVTKFFNPSIRMPVCFVIDDIEF